MSTLSNKYCEIRHIYKQVSGLCSIQGAGSDIRTHTRTHTHTQSNDGDNLGELIASKWENTRNIIIIIIIIIFFFFVKRLRL